MNRTQYIGVMLLVCLSCLVFTSLADIRLPAIIGDAMVLQQQADVRIWGWADPDETVTVIPGWTEQAYTCTTGPDGTWSVTVKTPAAGGPYRLNIAGQNTIVLEDILIGEVWVCSGQSNMEWPLSHSAGGEEAIAAADYPQIRLFDVAHAFSRAPQPDCRGQWTACSPETVRGFSAVGYFYGLKLHREMGVPIGLIGSNWGGTLAEAWTSAETLRTLPEFASVVEELYRLSPEEAEQAFQKRKEQWKNDVYALDVGLRKEWFRPDFDCSAWPLIETPLKWEHHEVLAGFDGLVWFCTDVEVDAQTAARANGFILELGPIDDMDITWVNGRRVGGFEELGYAATPRRYDIPAGLITPGTNRIAVRVHDWLYAGGFTGSPEDLKLTPVNEEAGAPIPLAGQWHYSITVNQKEFPSPPMPFGNNSPTALYNGMIAPIQSFGIRGVIWYQGESNLDRAFQYRTLFPALIGDWRMQWEQGDFPFYYVQIAPYNHGVGSAAAQLREAQTLALAVPNTGMAVTMDIGDPADIHPLNKKDVGRRLALWALAKTYGKDIRYASPMYKAMEIQDDKIILSFDFTYGGLYALNGPLMNFTIAAADRRFVPAQALIDGQTVIVFSPDVKAPVAVRLAWGAADASNLFNLAHLPAPSFRTDNWPGQTR